MTPLNADHAAIAPAGTRAPIALSEFFDGHPVATFAIDAHHTVTHWNRACELLLGWSQRDMVGSQHPWRAFYPERRPVLADLVVAGETDAAVHAWYRGNLPALAVIPGAYEAEDFFPGLGASGHWLHCTAAPLRDGAGRVVGAIETVRDVTERRLAALALAKAHAHLERLVARRTAQLNEVNARLAADLRQRGIADAELRRRNLDLTELNRQLSMTQRQLLQSEKLASIGQLAAGVAHEINNPIGYVLSNFGTLQGYLDHLFDMLDAYQQAEASIGPPEVARQLRALREKIDLNFLREDIPMLMSESREGIGRVRHIVQDLKDFSHVDKHEEWQWADLHQGIELTLNIASNEIKYKADVFREFGALPEVECLPSQINQVVLNLLVNAAHATGPRRGRIEVRTGRSGDAVWIEVRDGGCGIAPEHLPRIFDPFFTTKAVGKGTGLGLSLAYGIVQKHRGRIDVDSQPGAGSTFRVTLPIRHTAPAGDGGVTPAAPG